MTEQQYFVTEFGHRIDFVPGYHAAHKPFIDSIPDNHFKKQERTAVLSGPDWTPSRIYTGCYKDLVAFSYVVWFLKRWNLLRGWKRALDLGGAEGTFSALFKASGMAEHVTNLDLVDYAAVAPNYDKFVRSLATATPESLDCIARAKNVFDLFPDREPMVGIYADFPHRAAVDEFHHADIYDASGKYDLVTTVGVFDLLDLDKALAKVRDLLTDGGLFVCVDEYWWWALNSTCIMGHFPYAVQRLTYHDLERYVGAHHPEVLPTLEARYRYMFDGKPAPTLTDWGAVAERQGLRVIGVERVIAKRHHRQVYAMPRLLKQPWFKPLEILRDIAHIRPGVGIDDLTTSIVTLAMVKA